MFLNSTSGGNVNAKYISRRVTLEDGFDAEDIKVIVNAYKPLGTNLYLYYKVKAEDDQTDFDDKSYVLMSQDTDASIVSGSVDDIKEFVYKTTNEKITYSSDNVEYDKFKTFAVKMVLTSNNAVTTVQTENKSFIRDLHSKALLNTDKIALENHRQRQTHISQINYEWQEMKYKIEELNNVRDEMLEIKCLLQEIISKKEL